MANKGQRMIFEDEYQYLKDLKEEHPDPSAEWGGGSGGDTIQAGTGITITTESDDTKTISIKPTYKEPFSNVIQNLTDPETSKVIFSKDGTNYSGRVVISDADDGVRVNLRGLNDTYSTGLTATYTAGSGREVKLTSAGKFPFTCVQSIPDEYDWNGVLFSKDGSNYSGKVVINPTTDDPFKINLRGLNDIYSTGLTATYNNAERVVSIDNTVVTTNTDQTIDCNKTIVRRYTPQSLAEYRYNFAPPKSSIASGIWEFIVPNRLYNSRNSYYAAANSEGIVDIKDLVPTNTSDLNNDSGFITGITSGDVTTALGFTPGTSNFSGSYTDLTDKPSIPTTATSTVTPTTTQLVFTYQDNTTETITLMTGASVTTTLS